MPELVMVFLRGWLMVSLVALNTVQISHGRTGQAMVVGFCISFLWWGNSSRYRSEAKWAGVIYALGASFGTLTGILIGWNWG